MRAGGLSGRRLLLINHNHENAAVNLFGRLNRDETAPGFIRFLPVTAHFGFGFAMSKHIEEPGFLPPTGRVLGRERHSATLAELVATLGLGVCTLIALMAVSVGIARAEPAGAIIDNEGGLFAVSLVLGLVFALMGGLTVLTLPGPRSRKH